MTIQEALQDQIDQIMDEFDFGLACAFLETIRARGDGYPSDWLYDDKFDAMPLRKAARKLLKDVAASLLRQKGEQAFVSGDCSYLTASGEKNKDDHERWVGLRLYFSTPQTNDGTAYEP